MPASTFHRLLVPAALLLALTACSDDQTSSAPEPGAATTKDDGSGTGTGATSCTAVSVFRTMLGNVDRISPDGDASDAQQVRREIESAFSAISLGEAPQENREALESAWQSISDELDKVGAVSTMAEALEAMKAPVAEAQTAANAIGTEWDCPTS